MLSSARQGCSCSTRPARCAQAWSLWVTVPWAGKKGRFLCPHCLLCKLWAWCPLMLIKPQCSAAGRTPGGSAPGGRTPGIPSHKRVPWQLMALQVCGDTTDTLLAPGISRTCLLHCRKIPNTTSPFTTSSLPHSKWRLSLLVPAAFIIRREAAKTMPQTCPVSSWGSSAVTWGSRQSLWLLWAAGSWELCSAQTRGPAGPVLVAVTSREERAAAHGCPGTGKCSSPGGLSEGGWFPMSAAQQHRDLMQVSVWKVVGHLL